MRLDDLPDQFQVFTDQARDCLDGEIRRARKAAEALNADRAAAEAALIGLKDQRATVQKQLDDTLANLHKGTTLAGLNAEISEAKKALEKLKADTAKATTAFEAVDIQSQAAEHQLNAVNNETQRIRQERAEATTAVDNIKQLLRSVSLR
jgi:chromosome segregation ATPase